MSAASNRNVFDALRLRWAERLEADPIAAVVGLLASRISLGPYSRLDRSEALRQIVLATGAETATDKALCAWLEEKWDEPKPSDTSLARFAATLTEAFRAVDLVPLGETRDWLRARAYQARYWLRSFYDGPSRDPEVALYATLTQGQGDRQLERLWLGLCRLQAGAPIHHAYAGLVGLRLMPEADGRRALGVPIPLVTGLLDFAEALAAREVDPAPWQGQFSLLAELFPMSHHAWERQFRKALSGRGRSPTAERWLRSVLPGACSGTGSQSSTVAPTPQQCQHVLDQIRKGPGGACRPTLQDLIGRYRLHAENSGSSYDLVRGFCQLANALLRPDPTWARELAHEAAIWEPYNPYPWGLLGRALSAEGDWRRAAAVFWHARRRFPDNQHSHGQLAHALMEHSELDAAGAVLRQAVDLFPDDPAIWGDLGHLLNVIGSFQDALDVYRIAAQRCPHNAPIAGGLASTLINLGELDEAEEWLLRREALNREKNRRDPSVASLRSLLERAKSGQRLPPRKLSPPPTGNDGDLGALSDITGRSLVAAPDLGQCTVWRRAANGSLARAEIALGALPRGVEKIAENALLIAAHEGWANSAAFLEQAIDAYPGDGVLRVHLDRARSRAGQTVDWSNTRARFPHLASVVDVAEGADIPKPRRGEAAHQQDTTEQRLREWLLGLAARGDDRSSDWATEDVLAAYHAV